MSTRRDLLTLLPVLLLYVAGLNPYFLPAQYDNVVYYFGAQNLAEEGTYRFQSEDIGRWPPVFSLVLAGLFGLGIQSVWAAKLVVVATVGASLWLGLLLFRDEGRPRAVTVLLLSVLLPQGYLMGTRIMSEWPYTAASLLFLYLLARLRHERRSQTLALAAGLVLGAATLTRWVGLFLGAAVVFQGFERWLALRHLSPLRRVLPEAVVGAAGAGLTLLWVLTRPGTVRAEVGPAEQASESVPLPVSFQFAEVPQKLADMVASLLFHARAVTDGLSLAPPLLELLLIGPGLLVLLGLAHRWRSGRLRAADVYALVMMAYLGAVYLKEYRYLVPVAPFLVDYFLSGCAWCLRRLRLPAVAGRVLVIFWAVLLVALDGYILLRGNRDAHGGLALWVSPTPEAFYRGGWLDLYRIGQRLRAEPTPGPLGVTTPGNRYEHAFSGRRILRHGPQAGTPFVLGRTGEPTPGPGYRELERQGRYVLYAAP